MVGKDPVGATARSYSQFIGAVNVHRPRSTSRNQAFAPRSARDVAVARSELSQTAHIGRGACLDIASIGTSKLVVSKLNWTSLIELGSLGGGCYGPRGIALDTHAQRMYVTCSITGSYRVVRADLDGDNAQNLGSLGGTLYYPMAIALDTRANVHLPVLVR